MFDHGSSRHQKASISMQGLQSTTCSLVIALDFKQHSLSRFEGRAVRQAGQQLTAQGIVTKFEPGDIRDGVIVC